MGPENSLCRRLIAYMRISIQSRKAGFLALICGAMLISFSGIFVKLSDTDPTSTGFYRLFLPLPLLLGLMLADGRSRPASTGVVISPRGWIAIHCAGFFLAADLVAWHWSLRFVDVATATLLGNTTPIWVALAGYLMFGERFSARFVGGLSISLIGIAFLVAGGEGDIRIDDASGVVLALLGAICYAGYLRGVKAARDRVRLGPVMFWTAAIGAAWLLPVALLTESTVVPSTMRGLLALMGLAFLSQVLGQGLITWSLAHLPAGFSSVVLLANPVASAYFAWLVLGETLAALQTAGCAIVLVGIYLARPSPKAMQ